MKVSLLVVADAPVDHISIMVVTNLSPVLYHLQFFFLGLPLRWDHPLSTRVRDCRLRLRDIFSRALVNLLEAWGALTCIVAPLGVPLR